VTLTQSPRAADSTRLPATSLFVTGSFPRRRRLVLVLSLLGGVLLAYSWSSELVDRTIGFGVADHLLGRNANGTPIGGIASGIVFAFVTGLAGSFTACNIAAFGAVGPLLSQATSRRDRFVGTVRPLGYLALGMLPVSAAYGAVVGVFGTRMPQFSLAATHGLSPRILQAMLTFGLIGLVMLVLGLAALGLLPDPLAAVSRRYPNAGMVLMGILIGAFLIGRPYPLFRDMFRHAAESHNPLYGAFAFVLQSLGNIVVMSVLFLLLSYAAGRPIARWLNAKPSRAAVLTAAAFLVAAAFMVVYWDVRLLGRLGYIWFPTAPWS
jgi:MFS family permease